MGRFVISFQILVFYILPMACISILKQIPPFQINLSRLKIHTHHVIFKIQLSIKVLNKLNFKFIVTKLCKAALLILPIINLHPNTQNAVSTFWPNVRNLHIDNLFHWKEGCYTSYYIKSLLYPNSTDMLSCNFL